MLTTPPPAHVQKQAAATPQAVLIQAADITRRLTDPTDRMIALLAQAQAHLQRGDKARARLLLTASWAQYQKIKPDPIRHFIPDERISRGARASLLPTLAVAFVVADDLDSAKTVLASRDNQVREIVYEALTPRYPQAAEQLRWSETEKQAREKRKIALLEQRQAARAEPDPDRRVSRLYSIMEGLRIYGGRAEALELVHELIPLCDTLSSARLQAGWTAELAGDLWKLGEASEARALLTVAETKALALTDAGERLQARESVEQTKRTMGMPHELEAVLRAQSARAGAIPPPPRPRRPQEKIAWIDPINGEVIEAIREAEAKLQAGNATAARAALHPIKVRPRGDRLSSFSAGEVYVGLGQMQVKAGALPGARQTLRAASKLILGCFVPNENASEEMELLERLARAQAEAGDKPGAHTSLRNGIVALTRGSRWFDIHYLDRMGEHVVKEDRQSRVLHQGALWQVQAGDWSGAVQTARRIADPAQRAITLAGIVRDAGDSPVTYPARP